MPQLRRDDVVGAFFFNFTFLFGFYFVNLQIKLKHKNMDSNKIQEFIKSIHKDKISAKKIDYIVNALPQ